MKTIFTLILLSITVYCQAQSVDTSVISNAGGTNSNSSFTIAFTIGETFIETISTTQSIEQGFWAGIASQEVLSTDEFQDDNNIISVYPNPVSDTFIVRLQDVETYELSLFNLQGQKVITQKVDATPQGNLIDISSLSQGVYILSLSIPGTKENKTFKIIKK